MQRFLVTVMCKQQIKVKYTVDPDDTSFRLVHYLIGIKPLESSVGLFSLMINVTVADDNNCCSSMLLVAGACSDGCI